jgi:DNA-binding response OmpR family regulator
VVNAQNAGGDQSGSSLDDAPRLVVIEDDRPMREMMEIGLSREGYNVRALPDGMGARELIATWRPDAVLLDLVLPKADGLRLLPLLRAVTQAPILVVSARGDARDKIDAKPFVFEELLARIGAALRRPAIAQPQTIVAGSVRIDLATRSVTRDRRRIELTPREYGLLLHLARNPRQVFAKEQLLEAVWGRDFDGGVAVVDRYVSYLRAKLDDRTSEVIVTVRGVGYSLAVDS